MVIQIGFPKGVQTYEQTELNMNIDNWTNRPTLHIDISMQHSIQSF